MLHHPGSLLEASLEGPALRPRDAERASRDRGGSGGGSRDVWGSRNRKVGEGHSTSCAAQHSIRDGYCCNWIQKRHCGDNREALDCSRGNQDPAARVLAKAEGGGLLPTRGPHFGLSRTLSRHGGVRRPKSSVEYCGDRNHCPGWHIHCGIDSSSGTLRWDTR